MIIFMSLSRGGRKGGRITKNSATKQRTSGSKGVKKQISAEWWSKLSEKQQNDYLDKHESDFKKSNKSKKFKHPVERTSEYQLLRAQKNKSGLPGGLSDMAPTSVKRIQKPETIDNVPKNNDSKEVPQPTTEIQTTKQLPPEHRSWKGSREKIKKEVNVVAGKILKSHGSAQNLDKGLDGLRLKMANKENGGHTPPHVLKQAAGVLGSVAKYSLIGLGFIGFFTPMAPLSAILLNSWEEWQQSDIGRSMALKSKGMDNSFDDDEYDDYKKLKLKYGSDLKQKKKDKEEMASKKKEVPGKKVTASAEHVASLKNLSPDNQKLLRFLIIRFVAWISSHDKEKLLARAEEIKNGKSGVSPTDN